MFKSSITLNWRGKNYVTPVTMDLLDEIDEQFNIMTLVMETAKGTIKITRVARLVSVLLILAGAKTSPEDVYMGMGGSAANMTAVMEMMNHIIEKVYPHDDEAAPKKKVVTRRKKPVTRRKRKT